MNGAAAIASAQATGHNLYAYSVSEIAIVLKRMVEDNFGHVRIKGEISGWKQASSGHAYLKLKDENALLDAVCWKGTVAKLPFKPEDGMEVICSGKLTTYPGRSTYQLVIEAMEIAGVGALMALFEKRKHALAAEGLFDAKRKKPLPYMPGTIAVVTSPTGAVIRDILHRLSDRFPSHVMVYGVAVQGEGAAEQIASAVRALDAIDGKNGVPKPDLIIVARGGGSLEDLWAFNEEVVVRAVAAATTPVISAVGHETDTTLIDYAADRRAPTPTAAAEMAVPVRSELQLAVLELGKRQAFAALRGLEVRRERIKGLARGLPQPISLIEAATLRLDDWAERLVSSLPAAIARKDRQLAVAEAKFQLRGLMQHIRHQQEKMKEKYERVAVSAKRHIIDLERALQAQSKLLDSLNPANVLERGFVMVRSREGKLLTRFAAAQHEDALELQFFDGIKIIGNI